MTGTVDRSWKMRRTTRPLPGAYVAAVLLATAATGVLPHFEELWRCLRRAGAEDERRRCRRCFAKERPDTDAVGAPLDGSRAPHRNGPGGREPRKRSAGMSEELRPGVLFDMDGTLMDTNYLHSLAWSRAFRDAGEWAPMNAIHRLIGMGGDQLVPELLGHDSPAATAARPHRYSELMGDIRAFPGSRELLQTDPRPGPHRGAGDIRPRRRTGGASGGPRCR